jgi:glutathione S-transferase
MAAGTTHADAPLRLYYHPLASFCWKVLIALYENDTPFEPILVDLGDPASRSAFAKVWPLAKFPVLRDDARGQTVPESGTIIEYLARHHPGPVALVPADPDQAREARLRERIFDCYVQEPMQKIVGDHLRPEGGHDPHGVEQARMLLRTTYDMIDAEMATRAWAMGDVFGMADCAAAPALYYADRVEPFGDGLVHLAGYLQRLRQRPSFVRVLEEAGPYFAMFPG